MSLSYLLAMSESRGRAYNTRVSNLDKRPGKVVLDAEREGRRTRRPTSVVQQEKRARDKQQVREAAKKEAAIKRVARIQVEGVAKQAMAESEAGKSLTPAELATHKGTKGGRGMNAFSQFNTNGKHQAANAGSDRYAPNQDAVSNTQRASQKKHSTKPTRADVDAAAASFKLTPEQMMVALRKFVEGTAGDALDEDSEDKAVGIPPRLKWKADSHEAESSQEVLTNSRLTPELEGLPEQPAKKPKPPHPSGLLPKAQAAQTPTQKVLNSTGKPVSTPATKNIKSQANPSPVSLKGTKGKGKLPQPDPPASEKSQVRPPNTQQLEDVPVKHELEEPVVIDGGYVDSGDEEFYDAMDTTVDGGTRTTDKGVVGIKALPNSAHVTAGDEHEPEGTGYKRRSRALGILGLPRPIERYIQTKVFPHIKQSIGRFQNPFRIDSDESCALFREIFRIHFHGTLHENAISGLTFEHDSDEHRIMIQKVYKARSSMATFAVKVVEKHMLLKFQDANARAKEAKRQTGSPYPFLSIATYKDSTGTIYRTGLWRNYMVLEVLHRFFNSVKTTAIEGSDGEPVGLLTLAAVAIERAFMLWQSGEYDIASSKTTYEFSTEKWQRHVDKYVKYTVKLKEEDWTDILNRVDEIILENEFDPTGNSNELGLIHKDEDADEVDFYEASPEELAEMTDLVEC
ncbi:hypothetical protein K474DRAFT_1714144 [Panus rudis PR-1116 ss-1]|nr:hypothetical protein K474DRAFT_1714144 [Panus rudis PR-1116 ss-1]